MFNRKELVRLIVPLIIEQTLAITIGLADTLMVSSIGEAAVSGVSLIDSFNNLLIQILAALATGGSVVVSQYLGSQDTVKAKRASAQIVLVVLTFSGTVALLVLCLRGVILRTVYGAIDDDVMRFAQTYFLLSACSYPFMALYNAGAALFRVMGNSKISMLASLVMNVVNIAGNALLIFVFHMGVAGAAIASLVSRAGACFTVMIMLQRRGCPLRIDGIAALRPQKNMIRSVLAIGIPGGVENGMFQIGKLCVSSLTSTLGTSVIAANAVGFSVSTILNIPAVAIGLAVTPVVGRCLGAGDREEGFRWAKKLMGFAYLGCVLSNIFGLVIFDRLCMTWFSLAGETEQICLRLLFVYNIVAMFLWPLSFTMPKVLQSGGDARYTMRVSIISMWLFRVGLCYLLTLQFHCGIMGIWAGMFIDWGFRALLFGWRFLSKKWMEHKVI